MNLGPASAKHGLFPSPALRRFLTDLQREIPPIMHAGRCSGSGR